MTATADGDAATAFRGDGEMARRCRALDWSATPLGPVAAWPAALRTAVRLMLASPLATSLWVGDAYTLVYNDAYARILGAKHPAALGRSGAAVWEGVWPTLGPEFAGVREGGPAVFADDALLRVDRLDGGGVEDAWFTYALSALADEDGRCLAVYNVTVEVSQRARAERERAAERDRLFEAFQRVPSFVSVVTGPDHVLAYANEAYYTLVGRRDIIGRPVWEVLPDARGQGFEALLDGVRDTGVPVAGNEAPLRLVRTPGGEPEERFVDFVYQALSDADGARWGVMGYGTDVTAHVLARREVERLLGESRVANAQLQEQQLELQLANQQLQEQAVEFEVLTVELQSTAAELAERTAEAEAARVRAEAAARGLAASEAVARRALAELEATYRTAPVGLAVLDANLRFTRINERLAEMNGVPASAHVGRPVREVLPTIPADAEGQLRRVLETGEPAYDVALSGETASQPGVVREWLEQWLPLRDEEGAVVGVSIVAEEVTGRRAAEAERERLLADAQAARAAAEAADRGKSQFLATMSHELRTPLNAISGYAQLLDMGLQGPVTPEQRAALARIDRAQRHLLGLVNDVLTYASLGAGRLEYDIRPTLVATVVADVLPMVEPQLAAQGLSVAVYLPEAGPDGVTGRPPVPVLADREKLGQVFLNLLSNALKFTPRGGRITVDLATPDEGVGPGTRAYFRVADTGIGIPAEKLEAIFEPFVQVRTDYARDAGGTGLGLAISRDLVRGMGGDITVESTPGVGSTFTVTLPRAPAVAPDAKRER